MNIILYTKTGCPWGKEVIELLQGHHIDFEERNMTEHEEYAQEAIAKSGICKCPTLDIDGEILTDSDVEQVETFLVAKGLIQK